MMIISLTTIIAGAAVVLLAVLGSLINPFLRSLRLNKEEEQSAEGKTEDAAAPATSSSHHTYHSS